MKKIIAIICFSILTCILFSASVSAESVVKKYVGDEDEISWTLYDSGRLYIYGDAAIPNFEQYKSDWSYLEDEIVSVEIEDGVTAIGKYAFYAFGELDEVIIPESVTSIGMGAFAKCKSLKEITIPGKVGSIPFECFSGCSKLKTVNLPESIEYIRAESFKGCTKLSEIVIPTSVTSIGYNAFIDCISLESVIFLGDSPNSIGDESIPNNDNITIYYGKNAEGFDSKFWSKYNLEIDTSIKSDSKNDAVIGDIDGDGKVNTADYRTLVYILAGYSEYDFEDFEDIADVNGDGKFNLLDSIYLARYIDGWDDYEI